MNTINKSLKRKERRKKNERMKMGRNCCLKCKNCGAIEGGKEKNRKEKRKEEERSRAKKIR